MWTWIVHRNVIYSFYDGYILHSSRPITISIGHKTPTYNQKPQLKTSCTFESQFELNINTFRLQLDMVESDNIELVTNVGKVDFVSLV